MLVLSRKKNQSIIIDGKIEIMIMDIKSEQVKVGIIASKEVKVYRKEVYDKIKDEMLKAAKSQLPKIDEDKAT